MSAILLVVWFAVIDADRVDMLAGRAPFLLTPFLVFTPLVLAVEAMRTARGGTKLVMPEGMGRYGGIATLFLVVVGTSVFFSLDQEVSAKRYALLVVMVYGTLATAALIANRPDRARIVVHGAYAGLLLGLAFNAGQVYGWLARGGNPTFLLGGAIDISPRMYGPWFPRLSGQVLDQNRGGMLFMVYTYIVAHFAAPSRARTWFVRVGALLTLLTISRSVILAFLVLAAFAAVRSRRLGLTRGALVGAASVVAVGAGWLILNPQRTAAVVDLLSPLLRRFDTSEGSASMHFQLIARGWEVTTESLKNAVIGIGYGNASAFLQDFFPGDKYGNFHSVYVTLMAESGVAALALGLVLMFVPVGRSRALAPLLLGLGVFNVFYQLLSEPMFWFVLVAAWSGFLEDAPSARPAAETPALTPVPA